MNALAAPVVEALERLLDPLELPVETGRSDAVVMSFKLACPGAEVELRSSHPPPPG